MSLRTRKLVLSVLAFGALFATRGGVAEATTYLNNPYGDEHTDVVAGSSGGYVFVVFRRRVDRDCSYYSVGTSANNNTLADNVVVSTFNGDDVIGIQNAYLNCKEGQIAFGSFAFNGYYIDVYAGGGNDFVQVGQNFSYGFGESGHDRLVAKWPNAMLDGGSENDQLVFLATGSSSDAAYGRDGNDCLWDQDFQFQAMDCGNGTDKFRSGMSANGLCELSTATTQCNTPTVDSGGYCCKRVQPCSARSTKQCGSDCRPINKGDPLDKYRCASGGVLNGGAGGTAIDCVGEQYTASGELFGCTPD